MEEHRILKADNLKFLERFLGVQRNIEHVEASPNSHVSSCSARGEESRVIHFESSQKPQTPSAFG